MIEFAVIAMPRSGTAWASVFLGDGITCLHDPLSNNTLDDLAERDNIGVSCTALWMHPEFIYNNVKRWVIINADKERTNRFAEANNLKSIPCAAFEDFTKLRGTRINMQDLFNEDKARDIFEYLRPNSKFDSDRFNQLKELNITSRMI